MVELTLAVVVDERRGSDVGWYTPSLDTASASATRSVALRPDRPCLHLAWDYFRSLIAFPPN